jgi:MFS family permease
VIVVIMAYINEEFPRQHVGRAMSAYVSGTVLGGFLGRYISGVVAHNFAWREAFIAIGLVNLAGAIIVQRSLPRAKRFVRAASVAHSLSEGWQHLRNPRLLAVFGMGFAALFCLVGTFTYANFYLANPPYHLNSQQLGSVFFVDVGALADRHHCRLGVVIVGRLHLSGGRNGADGSCRGKSAIIGCGIVRDVLLHRRRLGSNRHRMGVGVGRLATLRVSADGSFGSGAGDGVWE